MFYTPKYCSECGGEIEQSNGKFWTNHRFCENCRDNFKGQKWLPVIWISAGLLGIIYGFGVSLKKLEKPVNLTASPAASAASNKNQNLLNQSNPQILTGGVQPQKTEAANAAQTNPPNAIFGQKQLAVKKIPVENWQNQPTEAVYICGAQTKKGTACSRRVKGGGRCWQHLGQPAILPPEKLLVSR